MQSNETENELGSTPQGFRVRVGSQCWLVRGWRGDPGRTAVRETGTVYETRGKAEAAIKWARKTHGSQPREYTVERAGNQGLLTEKELDFIQHSLGVDQYGHGHQHRNHFVTDSTGSDGIVCEALVAKGFMCRGRKDALSGGNQCYHVTDAGKRVMYLESRLPPAQTKSQRRYLAYLREDSGLTFSEWLAAQKHRGQHAFR